MTRKENDKMPSIELKQLCIQRPIWIQNVAKILFGKDSHLSLFFVVMREYRVRFSSVYAA